MDKVATSTKRGPKGRKIQEAFLVVPSTPTPAIAFAREHGVSIAVLRQRKRFDKSANGVVTVKKDKESKMLMIWRSV